MNYKTTTPQDRLKSKKDIAQLFEVGNSLSVNPIRLIYRLKSNCEYPSLKIGFAVSKKNFKRAVDRNLLKRRMREAFRLNSQKLAEQSNDENASLDIILLFQGQTIEDYAKINYCIIELLKKLSLKINRK